MIHILLADPDSSSRKALSLLLQRQSTSIHITQVADVADLIRALTVSSYDILLLDCGLYGSPAPETCRLLHRAYPDLRIALLSSDTNDAQAAEKVDAHFLHKSAPPDEFVDQLQKLLLGVPRKGFHFSPNP